VVIAEDVLKNVPHILRIGIRMMMMIETMAEKTKSFSVLARVVTGTVVQNAVTKHGAGTTAGYAPASMVNRRGARNSASLKTLLDSREMNIM
jgi:hypothetical protein